MSDTGSSQTMPPSGYWAKSYYPWLSNGWVVCACGETFASRSYSDTAGVRHADHVLSGLCTSTAKGGAAS